MEPTSEFEQFLGGEFEDLNTKDATNERLQRIAVLAEQNPAILAALWEEIKIRRERYVRRLANKLVTTSGTVGDEANQRELDFQKGVWFGAVLALVALPREAKEALEAQREKDETEGADAS